MLIYHLKLKSLGMVVSNLKKNSAKFQTYWSVKQLGPN